ncbi:MAG: hypothetical protein ACKVOR_04060 [Flavobacteriales bacterium]
MLEIVLLVFVLWAFYQKAERKGLSGVFWGTVGAVSYYVPLVLTSHLVVPYVVKDDWGIGSISGSSLASVAGGILACTIAWFILKSQKEEQGSLPDVLDSPQTMENETPNKEKFI